MFHIFFYFPHNKDMKKEEKKKVIEGSEKTSSTKKSDNVTKSVKNAEKSVKNSKKADKKAQKSENVKKKESETATRTESGNAAKKKKGKGIYWFLGVSAMSVALLLTCQFFMESTITGKEKFYDGTRINGLDVGGMSVAEAENVVLTDMLNARNEIEIELSCGDKTWTLSGNDFEVSNKIQPIIKNLSKQGRTGNFFQNLMKEKKVKENGQDFVVSYTNVLSNLDEKLNSIVEEVEQEARTASLVFQPDEAEVFAIDEGQKATLVNRDQLRLKLDNALKTNKKVKIEIPIIEFENNFDVQALKDSVIKRSEFSTSYATSSAARKNNVKKALAVFNGMIVQPGETISFNETTGARTEENGYKDAHIIVGGVYVDGVGGGVCQASTTLYNALLLADVEVLSVNHHSLPASYVPLSFDAMVSGSYSDLVFKNNLESPIYIKTHTDESSVCVEIYGQKFDDGISIKRRAELVKVLPHNGDKIVADTKGEYENKILYKGEYFRLKYPREGYESKGFLQYYKDGELIEEKEIRHDFYAAQDGVVMEGVEEPAFGMSIPASEVKIIKPQKVTPATEESVRNKLAKTNPSEFNP